ncbi:MAG: M20/M25/M40 family metallo-hydrolase [Candidatus Longimicrobiales bacterium M2_2A_002]
MTRIHAYGAPPGSHNAPETIAAPPSRLGALAPEATAGLAPLAALATFAALPAFTALAALATFATFATPAGGQTAPDSVDPARLRAHTAVLAHDSMEGRGAASPGEARAGRYLGKQLRALGLRPLPGHADDYRIPVPLTAYRPDPTTEHTLRIVTGDSARTLHPPAFYHPGGPPGSFRDFAGRLIVAGPTPAALEALEAYPDLTGHVVLLGPPWTDGDAVWAELERRGAAGVIEAVPSSFYHRLRIVRGPVRFALHRPPEADAAPDLPRVVIGPEALDALGLGDVIVPPDPDRAHPGPPSMPLRMQSRVEVDLSFRAEERTAHDIAGMIPGADPDLADEYIVLMAHYDHVENGRPADGDSLWNGFADNAAGVAVVLEAARSLTADPLPRSVVVLFTTAEEQGLLGATAFLDRAGLPPRRIAAAINIDGGAPPADIREWTVAAPEGSDLRRRAAAAIRSAGDDVRTRPVIADSDHWAFHSRGVPALFLYPDRQADGGRAHTPHDEWRPDFPFEGLARYAWTTLSVLRALANPTR